MIDPLIEVVSLLQPQAPFCKVVSGAGAWRIRRSESGRPFYCAIIDGSCRLQDAEHQPVTLHAGDFVLIPSADTFTMSSVDPTSADDFETTPVALLNGEFRLGSESDPPDVGLLVGYCDFGSPDAALLVSLLPRLVHVRGQKRLSTLVQLVVEESRGTRPAREAILVKLLEILLLEAFRAGPGNPDSPGLVRGMNDERLAVALRRMHEELSRPWTVEQMANEAALSRSAFYERFSRALGLAPMEYLFTVRMAHAKRLLRTGDVEGIAVVAERVGYASASAFSVAFSRHVGMSPTRFAQG